MQVYALDNFDQQTIRNVRAIHETNDSTRIYVQNWETFKTGYIRLLYKCAN